MSHAHWQGVPLVHREAMPTVGRKPPTDLCSEHNLWTATTPVPSLDGRFVYLFCSCLRPRRVTAKEWQQELDRRARATP